MNIGVLLSGGVGSRISSDTPKQYIEINGRMMITYPLMIMLKSRRFDVICIVADMSWRDAIDENVAEELSHFEDMKTAAWDGRVYADPGRNRQESILHAMEAVEGKKDDVIFIHDAARPFLSIEMIETVLGAIEGHDGVLPVLPMKDTVYLSEDGRVISELIDRQKVYAGQAPEAFIYDKYYEANKALMPDDILKINGSTEPAVMAGMDIVLVRGYEGNYKVTTDADLERATERGALRPDPV